MNDGRFAKPLESAEFASEYDIPTGEIQDLIARQQSPVKVIKLSLVPAGSQIITESGYGFAFYSYAAANTPIQGLMNVAIQQNLVDRTFPCAAGRGYVGAFSQLFLSWPNHTALDAGAFGFFLIFKSDNYPWSR